MRSISRCAVNPVHGPGDNQRNLPAIFHQAGPEWNKIPSLWNHVRHLAFCPLTVTRISPPKTHDSPSMVTSSLPARRPIVSAGLLLDAQPRQDYSTLCLQRSSKWIRRYRSEWQSRYAVPVCARQSGRVDPDDAITGVYQRSTITGVDGVVGLCDALVKHVPFGLTYYAEPP
jgi:hypothetical protein